MSAQHTFPIYDDLSYPDFLVRLSLPPRLDDLNEAEEAFNTYSPFLLSAKATEHWQARKQWALRMESVSITSSDNGDWEASGSAGNVNVGGPSKPNFQALRRYADQVVPVADTFQPEFSEFKRTERRLGEVLDLWESGHEDKMGENSNSSRAGGEGLYVKDWHLLAEIEESGRGAGEVYQVPPCFRDDWLNPPYSYDPRHSSSSSSPTKSSTTPTSTSTSDFRFTYLGPAGTYTPLHRDVYSSYSWSCNIVGRKLWWLFPPDRLGDVLDINGEPVFDVRDLPNDGGGIKVVQEEGQVIWVPSGWYHQVLNLDFCISINHNFFSAPTLPRIFSALIISQNRVEESIQDVKEMIIERLGLDGGWEEEWVEEVQGLLERDAGWGWKGFWDCVQRNLAVPTLPLDAQMRREREGYVKEVIGMYKERREWVMLPDIRRLVESIEASLQSSS